MYLKRVEVYGFKSFADKTELAFSPGITAIVGPNGSGKSNIQDAIRWALGEQSARTLRGSKMEDVIFSGSGSRKPLGFAEVTLVFDNTDCYLPVDFLEVQVTRRVYRSGSSEFFISGVPCRLKDIHILFMDTGLGKSGYSVIEQGRIDAILAAGSDQRRAFFEEAAGIHRYKTRRNETERRLEAVGKIQERLRDLIAELRRQLGPLAKRAEEARKFQNYSNELSTLEIGLILTELDKSDRVKDDLLDKLTGIEARQSDMKQQCNMLEDEILREKASLAELEDVREEIHTKLAELGAEIEGTESTVGMASSRLTSLDDQLISLEASSEKDMTALTHSQRELEEMRSLLIGIKAELEDANEHLKAGESLEESLTSELDQERKREERLKVDIIEVLSELAEVKNELSRLKMADEAEERQAERDRQMLERAEQELDNLSLQLERDTLRLEELNTRQHRLKQETAKAEEELQCARDRLGKLYEVQRELERQTHAKSLELEACRLQAIKGRLYPEGTRAVIDAAERNAFHGVIGTLGSLIRVPGEYEHAIEAALGRSLYNIVVEKETHAKAIVAYLKEHKLGRATFLPLDLISPSGFPTRHNHVLEMPGVRGIASQLVSYDESLKKAVEFSLGRILVTDNLDIAVSAARALNKSLKIVTIDGDIVFPGGAISGGSRVARPERRLLEAGRRLSDLELDVKRLRKEGRRVIGQMEEAKDAIQGAESLCKDLASQWRSIELENAKLSALKAERRGELDKSRLRAEMLRFELESRVTKRASPDGTRPGLERRYEELTAVAEELSAIQARISQRMKELSSARDDAMRDITAIKVKIAARSQEAENLKRQILAKEASIRERASEVDATRREIIRVKDLISEACPRLEESKAYLDTLRKARLELDGTFASVRDRRREAIRSINDKEGAVKALQIEIGKLEKDETTLRLQRVEVQEGARHMVDELARIYRMTPEEARRQMDPAQYESIKHRDDVREEIRILRDRMDIIGAVDLGAIEVYESMKSRREYLEEGFSDIEDAMEFLGQIMQRYDEESERRFRETFDAVRREFSVLFSRLFRGGTADLILVDSEGSDLPGVEIVAEPPGKRLQNLTLLSTGERALAAIALVFAILKIRPSPCCVLDEIDAALDEANVGRFADLLRDSAEEGQFIVVTHRKGTMESVDALYGVTMEESGVSRLVSLNLEDAPYPRQETA
ncbi:MAG: chromosome segregation protein SMC [Firmicutes bacterium]|nr:chromosome segregation protein SMC [Bacillota bacterium]